MHGGKQWKTALCFLVGLAAPLAAFYVASLIWPDLAGVLGHAVLIPTLLISGFIGLNHARANRTLRVPAPGEQPKG
jgi:cytochrome c oxidase subunit IV